MSCKFCLLNIYRVAHGCNKTIYPKIRNIIKKNPDRYPDNMFNVKPMSVPTYGRLNYALNRSSKQR